MDNRNIISGAGDKALKGAKFAGKLLMKDVPVEEKIEEELEFIDRGEEPEKFRDLEYREEIMPLIEDETGLEHPEEPTFYQYDSTPQIYHDLMKETAIEGLEDKKVPVMRKEVYILSPGTYVEKKLEKLYERRKMEHRSRMMSGAVNPLENSTERANLSMQGIRFREKYSDVDLETERKLVQIHEGIHLVQHHNFPELNREDEKLDLESQEGEKERIKSTLAEGHATFYTRKVRDRLGIDREFDMPLWRRKLMELRDRFYGLKEEKEKYGTGAQFISEVHKARGRKGVNEALRDPPETMEEVHNPERYLVKKELEKD